MAKVHHSPATNISQISTKGAAWLKTAQAAKLIGLSPSWLKNYRLNKGLLIEGVHWIYTNSSHRAILYNVELLCDFLATRADPEQHQRTIEAYLAAQSNKRSTRRKQQRTGSDSDRH
jgi:hypothetical protein